MRAPTRPELLLVGLCIVAAFLVKGAWGSDAEKESELARVRTERDVAQRENVRLRAARNALITEKEEVDRIATDSIAHLEGVIEDAERRATEAASAGRETFVRIIEAIPDDAPEIRSLVERRERMHENQVAVLELVIDAERDAASVLRNQLSAANALVIGANALITGLESELGIANEEIALLDDLLHPGLSTLESVSLSVAGYFTTTELLGGSTLEGLVVGGSTFVVLQGGSRLLDWLF